MKREGSQYEQLLKHIQELEHQNQLQAQEVRLLHHQVAEEKQRSSELTTKLQTVQALQLAVFSGLKKGKLFDLVVEGVVTQGGWDTSFIISIGEEDSEVLASYNATKKQLDHLTSHLHRNPIVTESYAKHHTLLTHEAEQHHTLVLRSLFQSEEVVLLPIVRGGHCYGYLVACDTHGTKHLKRHHREDVDFLAHLTKTLAYAAELS